MPSFKDVPIQIEDNLSLGNILPLLHEIRHALSNLLNNNEDTLIDLYNLPLSSRDKQNLLNTLGKGEITADLNALGHSLLWETAFPGVWVVEHYNTDDILLSHTIEITWIPSILKAQPVDVQAGLERLQERLQTLR